MIIQLIKLVRISFSNVFNCVLLILKLLSCSVLIMIDVAETAGQNLPRINLLTQDILSSDKSEPPSTPLKLGRSKTEWHKNNNTRAEEAAQFFDEKIPVQQKVNFITKYTRAHAYA